MSRPDTDAYDVIGRFEIKERLGQGGMGVVFRAFDPALERDVAIKLMHVGLAGGDEIRTRFLQEARAAARLTHQNIVAVYDVGLFRERVYIAMEYVEGSDLKQLIPQRERIALAYRVQLIAEICRGLHYAHEHGILHRDVKPSNIRVKTDGTPKLLDFGLARVESHEITQAGTFLGSPAYMSPEQIADQPLDARSDLYSVGVVLYEWIAGHPPFQADTIASLLRKIIEEPPPPLSGIAHGCPDALSGIVARALAKDPADRFRDCRVLADALLEIDLTIPGATLVQQVNDARMRDEHHGPGKAASPQPGPPGPEAPPGAAGAAPASGATGAASPAEITMMAARTPPSGFFDASVLTRSRLFPDDRALFKNVEETLKFYRDHLSEQYHTLSRQAKTTYWLWIGCVGLGFLTLVAGVVAMLSGYVQQGLITAAASGLVFFIQRVFQQREDHYRAQADHKNRHLEYGNQWLLAIQSIEGIQDPAKKVKRQARLVDALIARMTVTRADDGT